MHQLNNGNPFDDYLPWMADDAILRPFQQYFNYISAMAE